MPYFNAMFNSIVDPEHSSTLGPLPPTDIKMFGSAICGGNAHSDFLLVFLISGPVESLGPW